VPDSRGGRLRRWLDALRVVAGDARAYAHGASLRARWARQRVTVMPGAVIKEKGRVILHPGVVVGRDTVIVAGAPECVIEVGAGTRFNNRCFVTARQRVTIGRDVLFSNNVFVCDHVHAFADLDRPVMGQGMGEALPVAIGDGTWLGINVAVMPGVRIGRHCVIGANAVVTDDLPDGAVAAGVPARVLRVAGPPAVAGQER